MVWFHRESDGGKKTVAEGGLWVQKQKNRKKKKTVLETGGRRASWGFSFLMVVCSLPRHVEVSGWTAAMQELCLLFSEGQSKRDQDQSNALNKTDFPVEVSKAFSGFDLKSIT